MKTRIAMLLLLILLMILTCSEAENGNGILSHNTEIGYIYDACPLPDGIALLGINGIWMYQPDNGQQKYILNYVEETSMQSPGMSRMDQVFSANNNMYLFSKQTTDFYQVNNHLVNKEIEELNKIFEYDDQGEIKIKQIVSTASSNEGVFFLLSSMKFEEGKIYELYYCDLTLKQVISYGKQDIDMLFSCTNDQLLAGKMLGDGQWQELYLLDKRTGEFYRLNERTYRSDSAGFVWSEEQLYFLKNSGELIVERDGKQETFGYLSYDFVNRDARAFLWNESYVYLQEGEINVRSLHVKSDNMVTLTILGSVNTQIIRQYMAENPGMRIISDHRENTFLGLQEAILSRDEEVDLFIVESDGLYRDVVGKGYAHPLLASGKLSDLAAKSYKWVQDILLPEGVLIAIPVEMNLEYWTINQSIWREMNMGDYPKTYEEIWNAMEKWDKEYADKYPEYSMFESMDEQVGMIRMIMHQYILMHETWREPVNFNDHGFRSAVQQVLDHPELFEFDGESMPIIMNYPQYFGLGYNDNYIVESLLPPTLTENDDQSVRGTIEMLMLNPLSKHMDEAISFMEYYWEHLDVETLYMLDTSKTEPVRRDNYNQNMERLVKQIEETEKLLSTEKEEEKIEMLKNKLEQLEDRQSDMILQWRISPDDLTVYHRIAECVVIPTHTIYPERDDIINEVFDSLIERLVDGNLSMEQFIEKLNQRSRQIYNEQMIIPETDLLL